MKIFALACTLCLAIVAKAQDEMETDRPDQTETPVLVKKGYFQAEFGFNYENTAGRNYSLLTPTSLLKYSPWKRIEFRILVDFQNEYHHLIPDPEIIHGFAPIELGTKILVAEENKILPATSFIAHFGLPGTGSGAFKPSEPIASVVLTMQHTISPATSLGYNLGLKWEGYSSSPLFAYTIAPGFEITKSFSAFVEAFGFVGKENYNDHCVDAGISYFVNKNMKLDFSGGAGLSKQSPRQFFSLGFSFRIPLSRRFI
jgi:hypothetical protein